MLTPGQAVAALSQVSRRSGAALDDDSTPLEMACEALRGGREEGRARNQIVRRACSEFGQVVASHPRRAPALKTANAVYQRPPLLGCRASPASFRA